MATSQRIERAFDETWRSHSSGRILRVRKGNRSVREIADGMNVGRPAASRHLKVLKSAGLVVVHVEGARRFYGIDPIGIEALKEWLDGFWDTTLAGFKRAAELEQKRLEN